MLAETEQSATPLANFYQSMVLATPAGITAEDLEVVLRSVLDAHGMLRARLEIDGVRLDPDRSRARRLPAPHRDQPVRRTHGEPTSPRRRAAAAAELAPEDGAHGARRVVRHPGRGQLLLVIHHLVIDGVSWRILGEDLARAWTERAAGRAGDARRRPDVVPDVVDRDRAKLGSTRRDYWNDVLSTPDPDLGRRPLDPAIDTAATVRSHDVSLPPTVSSALLSSVPAAMHGGVNDVLLTALALALAQWRRDRGHAATSATVLNLEGHGREADLVVCGERSDGGCLDLSRTVGWFTAIYPARIDPGTLAWADVLAAGPSLAAAAKSVKEQLRTIPSRGLGYGVLRYLDESKPIHGARPTDPVQLPRPVRRGQRPGLGAGCRDRGAARRGRSLESGHGP